MATIYAAHAFHDSFENGRGSGELSVTPTGFRFRSGERTVNIPYDRVQLTLGGASDRLVFIAHPALPGWSIYTGDLAMLRDPVLQQRPELAPVLAGLRRRRARNWTVLAAIAVLVLAAPVALLFNMDMVTRAAARQVPPAWEEKLGTTAFGQYQIVERPMLSLEIFESQDGSSLRSSSTPTRMYSTTNRTRSDRSPTSPKHLSPYIPRPE